MFKKMVIGLVIFVVLIVVLLVGAFLALPHIVPLEDLRARLETEINKSIQGSAKVGDLTLSTFPWLGVRVLGLEIKNGKVFRESTFLNVGEAGVRIKVLPLFTGKVLGEIRIDKPVIRLEKTLDGQSSLALLFKPKSAAEKAAVKAPAPATSGDSRGKAVVASFMRNLQIKAFALKEGELRTLTYNVDFKTVGEGLDIQHLDLRLENLTPKGEVPIKLKAALFNPYRPDFVFEGLLQTDLDLSRFGSADGAQRVVISSASIHLGEIVMRLTGDIQQRGQNPYYVDIKSSGEGIALGRLEENLPLLAKKLPKDLTGDLSFNLSAVGHLGERTPEFKGDFKPLRVDLKGQSKLMSFKMKDGSTKDTKFENTELESHFSEDILTLQALRLQAFDGQAHMDGTVSMKDKAGPQLDLKFAAQKMSLAKLNESLMPHAELLEGTAELKMTIAGLMTASADEAKTKPLAPKWLKSEGQMDIGPGKLKTMNLMNETLQALVAIAPITPEIRKELSRVEWRTANMHFRVLDGGVMIEPMVMDYGSAKIDFKGPIDAEQKLNLGGQVVLPPKTLESLGAAYLGMAEKDKSLRVPLRITGTLGKPIPYLDVKRLVKEQVTQLVKEEVNKVIPEESKKALKDLLTLPAAKK